jgi:hypothetical protein
MRWQTFVIRRQKEVMTHPENREQIGGADNSSGIRGGGSSMRSRLVKILGAGILVALALVWNSCGTQPGCPTCGTTTSGAYGVIDVIPVPEHNPTGEPGGPFNSFDISWFDPNQRVSYVSDRIGLDVVVTDTLLDSAVNTIGGLNEVAEAGNNGSPCIGPKAPVANGAVIPSIITGQGSQQMRTAAAGSGLTRMGCRNAPFFANFGNAFPGFGANGFFGGFPGAQCCASRANGVNPISGPDGLTVTPDGKTLFVGSGSASVVAFDVTGIRNGASVIATVIADFPTGSSPDFDGPAGVAPCIATWNGGAGTDPTCADDRADENAYGTIPAGCTPSAANATCHAVFVITNGDPALPIVTVIDVTDIVNRNYTTPIIPAGMGICAPANPAANYTPGVLNVATLAVTGTNYPTCILGQIYYDASANQTANVAVDSGVVTAGAASTPCPDPSTAVPSGVTGTGVGAGGADVPCHHAPIVDVNTGFFITNTGAAGANQQGEFAVAGMGAVAFNPFGNGGKGTFYVENLNCTVSNLATQSSVAVGCIDEIDPRIGNPNGPVVINVVPTLNCMPAGIVQGPGHDFLVGCGGHDGTQFPPQMIIFDGTCTTSQQCVNSFTVITQTGGTDEVWFNPGDMKYYTAGRDMPNGPVMGVIDARTRTWLVNVPTGSNAHSITADSFNNHILVPLQAGPRCTTQSSNGCIGVYAQQ